MKARETDIFRKISIMKFILILQVVLIHCNFPEEWHVNPSGEDVITLIMYLIRASVPCFFVISGYLYFRNVKTFTVRGYMQKTRRRVFSLLVPYLLWNCVFLVYLLVKIWLSGNAEDTIFADNDPIFMKLLLILKGFWSFNHEYPYAFAFWFVRNLIVFCSLSPVAYLLARNLYVFLLFIVLLVIWGGGLFGFEYFVIGAFISCRCATCERTVSPTILMSAGGALWLATGVGAYIFRSDLNVVVICETIFALAFCAGTASLLLKAAKRSLIDVCISSTFFIYAIHQFFANPFKKIYRSVFDLDSFGGVMGEYVATFVSLIVVSFLLWKLLKAVSPRAERILSGNRV